MKFDLGYINRIVVVSGFASEKGFAFDYVVLSSRKKVISFEKRGKGFEDVATLLKATSSKFPFVLHLEGKGIISRKAPVGENYRLNLLMNNSSETDFHFTEFRRDTDIYYSFTRRDLIDPIVTEFNEHGAKVIQVSTGPFSSGAIAGFVNRKELKLRGYVLQSNDKTALNFEKSQNDQSETISLGKDHFDSFMLPAIAAGAQVFNPNPNLVLPEDDAVLSVNLAEAKQKNIFRRFSTAMVILFVLLLGGNYLWLNQLNDTIEANYVQLSEHEGQLAQLGKLREEKERKETLLRSSGLLNKYFLSYYLMELGNSVPREISFDEIHIRPLLEEIKDKHKIEFMESLIVLNGKSKSSHVLQEWIERLETKEWIASVEIMNYTYTKNRGNFELQILLN